MATRKVKPLPRSIRSTSRTGNALQDLMKNDTVLVGPVERLLLANALADDSRPTNVIHPSELCKDEWCSRRAFYRITGVEPSNIEKLSSASEKLFSEGHFTHKKWQDWAWDLGLLEGEFKCLHCDTLWYDTAPGTCLECGQPRWGLVYMEVPIVSKELKIGGRADGKVSDYLLEIKSLGPGTFRMLRPELFKQYQDKEITLEEMWKSVKRPFVPHIKQAMFYGWIIGVSKILFIYEWKPYQAVKEFTVHVNEDYIEDMIEAAKDTAYAVDHDKLPRRPDKSDYQHKDGSRPFCKTCPFLDHCWSNDAKNSSPNPTRTLRVVRRRRTD